MKKIRYHLAAIALLATLSGLPLQGMAAGSLANAASSRHVSSQAVSGQSSNAVAFRPVGPCPVPGATDC